MSIELEKQCLKYRSVGSGQAGAAVVLKVHPADGEGLIGASSKTAKEIILKSFL